MDNSKLTDLNIQISASDATEEELDRMTRQLLSELRETNVESAELAKEGSAPAGTKSGDPVMMGSIVMTVLPAILPAIVGMVQTWATRGHGRIVKFKGKVGREMIEFEGSAEDLQRLLETLSKGKKKK